MPAARLAPAFLLPRWPLALAALALAWTAAPASSAEPPATPAAARAAEPRPKGKWPWFKRYRTARKAEASGAAPAPVNVAPAAAPAEVVRELPAAPPETPRAAEPASAPPAAREGALSQRRRTRTSRMPAAQAAAAEAPAAPRPMSRTAALPRELRRIDREARSALDLPGSGGALPLADLTQSRTIRRDLEPLQERLQGLSGGASDLAAAHSDFAAALIRHGLEEAGAAEALTALVLDPGLVAAWNNLATVLRRAGHLDLASDALDQATRLDPRSGVARFNKAMLLDAQGKKKDAELEYMAALELDPSLWLPQRNPLVVGNADAQRALHDLYMKRNARGGVLLDVPAR